MPTYSSSLRATLITSGTEAGTWGTTTNDNLDYVFDRSIAGYVEVVVASTDHVLTYNNGPVSDENLNQSICAILELTTSVVTTAFNVYAPPVSKQYIIWNNTAYTASIYNSASIGSTTPAGAAFTIAAGDKVLVWSDGTVFSSIKASGITGVLPTVNGGTGLSSFTANGVVYASSTSALATGSALQFDGTNLGIGTSSPGAKLDIGGTNNTVFFKNSGATTGYALATVSNTSGAFQYGISSSTGTFWGSGNAGNYSANIGTTSATNLGFGTSDTLRMLLDSSGNLGLGVTPSAWASGWKALQFGNTGGLSDNAFGDQYLTSNCYYDGGWKYITNNFATYYAQENAAHIWYTAASGTAGNAITFTQAMTLDASGNLGLGSTNPGSTRLDVVYSATSYSTIAKFTNSSTSTAGYCVAVFGQSASGSATGIVGTGGSTAGNAAFQNTFVVGAQSNSPLVFVTNDTERARITSGGDLLVGTTSANGSGGLTVTPQGQGSNTPAILGFNKTASGNYYAAQFRHSGTIVGSIEYSDTATSYVTSSDYRLKNTIAPMTGALAKVALLKPVTYKWKADGSDGEGFIAHELQAVVPQCVTGQKDAVDADGKPVYQGIDTSFLVATLTAAIQEQQALIESLTARIAALEAA